MLKQVLYDREISVTLYRRQKTVPALYKTCVVDSYVTKEVNGKKSLRLAQTYSELQLPGTVDAAKDLNSQDGAAIEFYQGNKIVVYDGEQEVTPGVFTSKYREIRASGPTFKYRTLDEMKRGLRPDGTIFHTGDRMLITEDNTKWCVVVKGGAEDVQQLYTEVEYSVPSSVLRIAAPDAGMKPDISLSISLLPNQNCYGAVVRIKNLNTDALEIRTWDKMVIEAGYKGTKVFYTCPIFSSYQESPNPDGVTVFEGVTVGVAEDILTDRQVEIWFNETEMYLEPFIRQVAKGITENIKVTIAIAPELSGHNYPDAPKIQLPKQKVYAQNGVAVLNWLQSIVSEFVQYVTQGTTSVFVQFIDGELTVLPINGPTTTPLSTESIINLDMVTSARYNGTALNVIAPWNPRLRPGDLFYMPPQFINGSRLPNAISPLDYRNERNLYRCLTMNVEFATVEEINKMTVLATPAQWAGSLPKALTTDMPADIFSTMLTEQKGHSDIIQVGAVDKSEVKASSNAEQPAKVGAQMIDNNQSILTQWGTWTSITQSEQAGNCVSAVSYYYMYNYGGGPKLQLGEKGHERQANYYEDKSWLKEQGLNKAVYRFQSSGIGAATLWWPLITIGTYWKRYLDNKAHASHNWSKVDPKNPDFIEEGRSLYIPVFPSGSWRDIRPQLAAIKDIWKQAYLDYKDLYPSVCRAWRAMYYYLGGTDEFN